MKLIKPAILALLIGYSQLTYSQKTATDTTAGKAVTLKEVVISVNKTEETKKTVAQQVQVLTASDIAGSQAQSTADLLASTGNVFVQKSQLGGGSISIRGFEANRNVGFSALQHGERAMS